MSIKYNYILYGILFIPNMIKYRQCWAIAAVSMLAVMEFIMIAFQTLYLLVSFKIIYKLKQKLRTKEATGTFFRVL